MQTGKVLSTKLYKIAQSNDPMEKIKSNPALWEKVKNYASELEGQATDLNNQQAPAQATDNGAEEYKNVQASAQILYEFYNTSRAKLTDVTGVYMEMAKGLNNLNVLAGRIKQYQQNGSRVPQAEVQQFKTIAKQVYNGKVQFDNAIKGMSKLSEEVEGGLGAVKE